MDKITGIFHVPRKSLKHPEYDSIIRSTVDLFAQRNVGYLNPLEGSLVSYKLETKHGLRLTRLRVKSQVYCSLFRLKMRRLKGKASLSNYNGILKDFRGKRKEWGR